MSKTITVWGSPGSGKSMFCCILAKALTRDKRKAIIINAEPSTPMLPIWIPEQDTGADSSIGQVLSSVEIDTSLIAGHVTVLKNYPYIGLMGYSAGENPLSYPDADYQMVLQLISAAKSMVDYLILDCGSSMTNVFTPAAIESGDLVIRILTPDLKGINYLKAHQPLLTDGRFHYDGHMTFAGMARPFHAFDEMGYIIGGFDGLLPYGKEIDRCATEGGMFQAVKYCNSKYTASLNRVLDALEQMEAAERQEEDWTDENPEKVLEAEDSYGGDIYTQDEYGYDIPHENLYEDGTGEAGATIHSHSGRIKRKEKPLYENRTAKPAREHCVDRTESPFPAATPASFGCRYQEEDTDE